MIQLYDYNIKMWAAYVFVCIYVHKVKIMFAAKEALEVSSVKNRTISTNPHNVS